MRERELRIVSLISGGGSTMEAILNSTVEGELAGKVKMVAVITDRVTPGISKATLRGIQGYIIDRKRFTSSEQWGEIIIKACKDSRTDILLLNGLLSLMPQNVIEEYLGRIFNQHSADPLYFGGKGMYGLRVHAAVLGFQEKVQRRFPTTAVIHHVTPIYDEGEIVAKKDVEVCDGDTPEVLAQRVLPHEHAAQIDFLGKLYEGKVQVLKRDKPLVRPGEEHILYQAKEEAINMYKKK